MAGILKHQNFIPIQQMSKKTNTTCLLSSHGPENDKWRHCYHLPAYTKIMSRSNSTSPSHYQRQPHLITDDMKRRLYQLQTHHQSIRTRPSSRFPRAWNAPRVTSISSSLHPSQRSTTVTSSLRPPRWIWIFRPHKGLWFGFLSLFERSKTICEIAQTWSPALFFQPHAPRPVSYQVRSPPNDSDAERLFVVFCLWLLLDWFWLRD